MNNELPGSDERLRQRTERRRLLLFAAAVAATAFAVYANTLVNGFVHDDFPQVVQNPWVRDPGRVSEVVTGHVWGFTQGYEAMYYRPVMYLLLLAVHALAGPEPWGFHLLNILLHSGVTVLVLVLADRLLREHGIPRRTAASAALAAAALFAVHPAHTEAVAWISALPDLSATLFSLLTLYFFLRADEGMRHAALLSVVCAVPAVFSKEPAVVLPAVLIVHDLALRRFPRGVADQLRRYGPVVAVVGCYLAARWFVLGGLLPGNATVQFGPSQVVLNACLLFAKYLAMLAAPRNLNFFHIFRPIESIGDPRALISLAAILAFCGLVWFAAKRERAALPGLAVVLFPLLPVLYLPGLGENPFAERYLYYPSVGFVLLVAVAVSRVLLRAPRLIVPGAFALAAIGLVFAIGTVRRNTLWRDNLTIWEATIQGSPDAAFPRFQLADELMGRQGRIVEAIPHYRSALRLQPDNPVVLRNLALAYRRTGMYREAIAQYRAILERSPEDAAILNAMGMAYLEADMAADAIKCFRAAAALRPGSVDILCNLGVASERMGAVDQAIAYFQQALDLAPGEATIRSRLDLLQERGTAHQHRGSGIAPPERPGGR